MTTAPTLAVIWIDWYAYHHARFRALAEHDVLRDRACGIELVGGEGVHTGQLFRDRRAGHLPVHTIMPDANWSSTSQWRLARLLWQKLNELRPSVVLVPGYYTAPGLAAALWARWHRARTILMSESTATDHVRQSWREATKRFLVRRLFDFAIVGGRRHRDYLQQLGFDGARIGKGYDVVDNTFYAEGTRRLREAGRPEGFVAPSRYFLFVGRLAAEKNIEMLLRSFSEYRRHGGTWHLVIVGDGPLRLRLAVLARTLAPDGHVVFAGHHSAEALLPYYAFASAFVLPSRTEPWGLVVNEAMAAGLPVLVSNACGAAADLVQEGRNGFTFDPGANHELTKFLRVVEALPDDERQAMGRASAELIEAFSPAQWADEVVRIATA